MRQIIKHAQTTPIRWEWFEAEPHSGELVVGEIRHTCIVDVNGYPIDDENVLSICRRMEEEEKKARAARKELRNE
jgi:hypothetical protein